MTTCQEHRRHLPSALSFNKIGLNEQDLSEAINRLVELEYLKEGAIALPDMSKHTSDRAEED